MQSSLKAKHVAQPSQDSEVKDRKLVRKNKKCSSVRERRTTKKLRPLSTYKHRSQASINLPLTREIHTQASDTHLWTCSFYNGRAYKKKRIQVRKIV